MNIYEAAMVAKDSGKRNTPAEMEAMPRAPV